MCRVGHGLRVAFLRCMAGDMQKDLENLKRHMRQVLARHPGRGVTMIIKAERDVICENAEQIALWAEMEELQATWKLRTIRGRDRGSGT